MRRRMLGLACMVATMEGIGDMAGMQEEVEDTDGKESGYGDGLAQAVRVVC